jgi:acyl carrier protein
MPSDISKLLQEVSGHPIPRVDAEILLADLTGWDSLATVRLMLRVEQDLGRELDENELGSLIKIGDVQRLLDGPR